MPRRKLHRLVFALAGVYNLAWGVYAVADPQWLFRTTGMPAQSSPHVFSALGMVIGLYGFIYLEVARVPERGWTLAAVGLAGKIIGPIGLAYLIATRQWPATTIFLCLTNDLVWWVPFGLYLHDAWPNFYREFAR
jgi:hypothetical protein